MNMEGLKKILFKSLKLGKAADAFKLTEEHLRYLNDDALMHVLEIENKLIQNINYISFPETKVGCASFVHKGKKKPLNHHKSYKRVTVDPFFGRILDEHMRTFTVPIYNIQQNMNQYGFSSGIDYKMGIIQRYECQQYAIDQKKTLFGMSVDAESAFDVVQRSILMQELYNSGEQGELWQITRAKYENTTCKVKLDGQLSRSFEEVLGVGQGKV